MIMLILIAALAYVLTGVTAINYISEASTIGKKLVVLEQNLPLIAIIVLMILWLIWPIMLLLALLSLLKYSVQRR
jgi:hypothetical protein